MANSYYTAQKSRGDGRQSFAVTFRHPLRTDSRGKPGLKVRRGLGTADPAEADRLVGELTILLSDERYWSLSARNEAVQRFSPIVVSAFYSGLEVAVETADRARDGVLPLPGADEGYSRVLLVGTTGSGKTTLLRHLIGSHPRKDRFPSTSPGKTTVADLELITAPATEDFRGVVTFLPERAVRGYVQECVTAACLSAWSGDDDAKVARHLLQHADQKFRLQYVLGEWPADDESGDEEWGFDADDEGESDVENSAADVPSEAERSANAQRLGDWIRRIRQLVSDQASAVAEAVGIDWSSLSGDALDAAEDILTMEIENSEEYADIVLEIIDQILARFERLDDQQLARTTTGWPTTWEMTSNNRDAFLGSMRWFTSNYAPRYGRLITPLVQGIRVRGPFRPDIEGVGEPKLVLIDGQGLGHTPDSAASVTTNITGRFPDVDVILLVDNATQPMQAAPLAVLRSVATGGYQEKLTIAFTHFDQVTGANVLTVTAKRDHVIGAARNVLNTLRSEIGPTLVRSLERELEARCFMLGWLDRGTERLAPKMRDQLKALLTSIELATVPAEPIPATPVYDPASVGFAVQAAARDFQTRWAARLGFDVVEGVPKAHWASVKALNRRIADRWSIEYRNLMPVADLFTRLSEEISKFLDQPVDWEGDASDAGERERAVSAVRRAVSVALHEFARDRVIEQHVTDWVRAHDRGGRGSTLERARDIRAIYEDAAPVPGVIMTTQTQAFLDRVRALVHQAVIDGGGKIAGVPASH